MIVSFFGTVIFGMLTLGFFSQFSNENPIQAMLIGITSLVVLLFFGFMMFIMLEDYDVEQEDNYFIYILQSALFALVVTVAVGFIPVGVVILLLIG